VGGNDIYNVYILLLTSPTNLLQAVVHFANDRLATIDRGWLDLKYDDVAKMF